MTDREYILFLEARVNALTRVVSWLMDWRPGGHNPTKEVLASLVAAEQESGEVTE